MVDTSLNQSLNQSIDESRPQTTANRVSSKQPQVGSASKTSKPTPIVCQRAELHGNVIFGEGCVVHPMCSIVAEGGDIVIGDYTIIEEFVKIWNQPRKDKEGNIVKRTMRIGNYNIFECGTQVSSSDIGDLNEFGVKCQIPAGSQIGNCCTIAPMLTLPSGTRLANYSVYFKEGLVRKDLQPREDNRKQNIKEMSVALAQILPQNNQLKNIGPDGREIPSTEQPQTTRVSTQPIQRQSTTKTSVVEQPKEK